ncbi:MAG: ABC transporter ATP-binding protein [Anaerolineaceae bacterium]
MSDIAIRVENLGKKYSIGANQARYQTIRESLTNSFQQSFQTLKGKKSPEENTIWALKDVNFEVKHGDVLGIIGRNGAGKSTLLKILARITKPTTGRIELNGRVGSLLEVGTGFHPELTGRENIYLSGAILGMKRKEIIQKFDEIVDFAEIEKFLDTPVKHYSSGMYMRLAFAVAANLDPDILIVDEVLAVGDTHFQKKCLGKMGVVANEGRTVLFVSHQLQVITSLCINGILLDKGRILEFGDVTSVITKYINDSSYSNFTGDYDLTTDEVSRIGTGSSKFIRIKLLGNEKRITSTFQVGETLEVHFWCSVYNRVPNQFYQIRIRSISGVPIYHFFDFDDHLPTFDKEGVDHVAIKIDQLSLYPGKYYLELLVSDHYNTAFDHIQNACVFDVIEGSIVNLERSFYPSFGIIHCPSSWERFDKK